MGKKLTCKNSENNLIETKDFRKCDEQSCNYYKFMETLLWLLYFSCNILRLPLNFHLCR
jgi:hypothetical protein